MAGPESARTRLEQVLKQRHMTLDDLRKRYKEVAGSELSERQAYRWIDGTVKGLPYPHSRAALERIFGEPADRLLGPPYGTAAISARRLEAAPLRGHARDDWQGQLIVMSAERARDFLSRAEATNLGSETLDQLTDDVRLLVRVSQEQPLHGVLGDMVDAQNRIFGLLEGRQRPDHTRDLYFLAGVVSGLLAKASHDLGAPHDAMTQSRAAYTSADKAGHRGLQAWVRGLQSGIAYWSGRFNDSLRYAHQGADVATQSRGTAAVRLASSEARSQAALCRIDKTRDALRRADEARECVQMDELDELGGLFMFSRPRQIYFAADALAWAGFDEAEHAESLALEALDAFEQAPAGDRAFGDEAGTRCVLAIARLTRREIEGAADALAPVLKLPPAQRIHGIVVSVENVHRQLVRIEFDGRPAAELGESLHSFTSQRLALPR